MNTAATLAHQRCYNHASREAAARCPECQRFFCRECVSEHDDRMLCASCLGKLKTPSLVKRFHLTGVVKALQVGLSVLIVWSLFYGMGRVLLIIPSAFHKSTLWQKVFW